MASRKMDEFCKNVCQNVKYNRAHESIAEELKAHMEDYVDRLVTRGQDEESAIESAVEAMGDPIQIGQLLNKQHRPYLGWLIAVSNCAILLLGLYVGYILIVSSITAILPFDLFGFKIEDSHVVKEITVDKKSIIDKRIVEVNSVYIMDDGTVLIRYDDYYANPFISGWSMLNFNVYDDVGNEYYGGDGSSGNFFKTRHLITLDDFDESAKKLILEYDRYNRKMLFEIIIRK